jgi:hypothetical protein
MGRWYSSGLKCTERMLKAKRPKKQIDQRAVRVWDALRWNLKVWLFLIASHSRQEINARTPLSRYTTQLVFPPR